MSVLMYIYKYIDYSGTLTSPGTVQDQWYLKYPDIHQMLLKQYKSQIIQYHKQQELMKRFSFGKPKNNNISNNNSTMSRHTHEHKNDSKQECCNHDHKNGSNHNHGKNTNTNNKNNSGHTVIQMRLPSIDELKDEESIVIPKEFARPERSHYSHELKTNVLRHDQLNSYLFIGIQHIFYGM